MPCLRLIYPAQNPRLAARQESRRKPHDVLSRRCSLLASHMGREGGYMRRGYFRFVERMYGAEVFSLWCPGASLSGLWEALREDGEKGVGLWLSGRRVKRQSPTGVRFDVIFDSRETRETVSVGHSTGAALRVSRGAPGNVQAGRSVAGATPAMGIKLLSSGRQCRAGGHSSQGRAAASQGRFRCGRPVASADGLCSSGNSA